MGIPPRVMSVEVSKNKRGVRKCPLDKKPLKSAVRRALLVMLIVEVVEVEVEVPALNCHCHAVRVR